MLRRIRILITSTLIPSIVATVAAAAPGTVDGAAWQNYTHPRLQFRLSFPADIFAIDPAANLDDGLALRNADGSARLLIGAFENEDDASLGDYRKVVLERSYLGAKLDYAPVRKTWFVVSGERDGKMFYERVDFTCGGRRITSWAMIYPVAERRRYDRIVERIAPTYVPSRGGSAGC
ncbi:MAG: hypothetical protein ACK4MF_01235 [Hyphomicrobiaceae bacterium]